MGTGLSAFSTSFGYLIAVSLFLWPLVWCAAEKVSSIPLPLSLPPSQNWDGNDGFWSSFNVQIGTPSQNVRLLPATSLSWLLTVLPGGCDPEDPSDCTSRRFSFHINVSSTWSAEGVYQLPLTTLSPTLPENRSLAMVGYDTITLGRPGSLPLTLAYQLIAGYQMKDFYIGTFGLNRGTAIIPNTTQLGILETLMNESKIPSLSWSYTAGAWYQRPKMFGSLTLGGYDTTRFAPNNVSFHMEADMSRDLLVAIQSITSDTRGSPLLTNGIYAQIDSLATHIWLPTKACQAFENAFSLVWNDSSELYLVTEDMHNKLVKLNPNVTFKLGPSLTEGDTVDIVMPYGSFDLHAEPPLVQESTRYFPLKRAQNDMQYTLGRAFLQQAYVIADYDRSKFSVHQALFPNPFVPPKLSAILPSHVNVPPLESRGSLSTGVIVGIVVSILLVIIISCCILAVFIRRKHKRRIAAEAAAKEAEESLYRKPELDNNTAISVNSSNIKKHPAYKLLDDLAIFICRGRKRRRIAAEAAAAKEAEESLYRKPELDNTAISVNSNRVKKHPAYELPDDAPNRHVWPQEMPASEEISPGSKINVVSELATGDIVVPELDGQEFFPIEAAAGNTQERGLRCERLK
ncbi:MAG: hypothetical protein M1816_002829 [Peltula sp. TS41687]|nr:MAG: hypothetical protein M1816_002829 [Peltula sp. TS41687]